MFLSLRNTMKNNQPIRRSADLQILTHHIYEYKKGIRNLVLHTMNSYEEDEAKEILEQREISYYIQNVSSYKINVFFGDFECIEIIRSFKKKSLSDYTPEQDFMLGTMLGYECSQQCSRYIKTQKKKHKSNKLLSIA